MTDERMGESLWSALERLPRGSGVVFRHYGLARGNRMALLARVERVADRRRLTLVIAGEAPSRIGHGVHGRRKRRRSSDLLTLAAHDRRELVAAVRTGADAVFVSPVFATRSHPGARALGSIRLGLMIQAMPIPVIALGGMSKRRAKRLSTMRIHGWAAIDAWASPAAG